MRNIMKKIFITLGIVAVVIIDLICILLNKLEPHKEYLSTSWMYGYADVEELTAHSDLIALIKVNGLSETINGSIPASIFEVNVTDGVLGCTIGDVISVYMTGGKTGNQIFEVKSDPLMKKGQEFLIFAQKNQDGTYTVLGGPQGRLVYANGLLNSLKNTDLPYINTLNNADVAEISKFDGLVNVQNETLEEIKARISSVLSKSGHNTLDKSDIALRYTYSFEEVDIFYYPNTSKFVMDNHNIKKEFTWNAGMNDGEDEIAFDVGSFLSNGKKQVVFHPVVGVGTGVLIEDIHVVDLETLEEYVIADFAIEAEKLVDMELFLDAENDLLKDVEKEEIFAGSYQYYEVKENSIIVNLNVSIQTYEVLGNFVGVLEEMDGKLNVREWKYEESK